MSAAWTRPLQRGRELSQLRQAELGQAALCRGLSGAARARPCVIARPCRHEIQNERSRGDEL